MGEKEQKEAEGGGGCVVRKCEAGGSEKDGGHVFDRVWNSEDGRESSMMCKCGVTAMSWHMMVGP